jgi:hypothetical protein
MSRPRSKLPSRYFAVSLLPTRPTASRRSYVEYTPSQAAYPSRFPPTNQSACFLLLKPWYLTWRCCEVFQGYAHSSLWVRLPYFDPREDDLGVDREDEQDGMSWPRIWHGPYNGAAALMLSSNGSLAKREEGVRGRREFGVEAPCSATASAEPSRGSHQYRATHRN